MFDAQVREAVELVVLGVWGKLSSLGWMRSNVQHYRGDEAIHSIPFQSLPLIIASTP